MQILSLKGRRWNVHNDFRGMSAKDIAAALQETRLLNAGAFPPFTHMPRVIDRVKGALKKNERIGVFGDYDCDGITSAVLVARLLRRHGHDPVIRLPHRSNEGYGIKPQHIQEMRDAGITLLIIVDTGITAHEAIRQANAAGMDTIIMDHHHCSVGGSPEAYAALHPQLELGFPEPYPSAAGVVWEFVQAFEQASGNDAWDDAATDRLLAALGTVADLVELRGGNRRLVTAGLQAISQVRGTLALLCLQAGVTEGASARDLAFRLAPRINAAGRMADPHIALRSLLGDRTALLELESLNKERQEHVGALTEDLAKRIDVSRLCLVDASPAYSPGIVGLLAGKLTEEFGRPSLVASIQGETCVASLRSTEAYHIAQGLSRHAELFHSFGGHAKAAGCSFSLSKLREVAQTLHDDIAAHTTPEELVPTLHIDAAMDIHGITQELCTTINVLEPFGEGNPEPHFLLSRVTLKQLRTVGADAKHLQARAGDLKLIGFRWSHLAEHLEAPMDIVCRIGMNTWNGKTEPQLTLEDARVAAVSVPTVSNNGITE